MKHANLTKAERARFRQAQPPDQENESSLFWPMVRRLFAILWFNLKPSEYLGKKVLYKGQYRKITAETFDYFFITEFNGVQFYKVGNKCKIR